MEITENQITLGSLPIGARLLVRTRQDWRMAVVSNRFEEKVTLLVCSPTGRTYRLRRLLESELVFEGQIPILKAAEEEDWRENLTKYDLRW